MNNAHKFSIFFHFFSYKIGYLKTVINFVMFNAAVDISHPIETVSWQKLPIELFYEWL